VPALLSPVRAQPEDSPGPLANCYSARSDPDPVEPASLATTRVPRVPTLRLRSRRGRLVPHSRVLITMGVARAPATAESSTPSGSSVASALRHPERMFGPLARVGVVPGLVTGVFAGVVRRCVVVASAHGAVPNRGASSTGTLWAAVLRRDQRLIGTPFRAGAYSCVPGRAGEAGRQLGRAVRCHLATDRFTPRQGSMK
jgi:hypothetical protein